MRLSIYDQLVVTIDSSWNSDNGISVREIDDVFFLEVDPG